MVLKVLTVLKVVVVALGIRFPERLLHLGVPVL